MKTFGKIATKTAEILGALVGTWFCVALLLLVFFSVTGGAIWSIRWVLALMGVIA
jgi:hypothetical protein